MDPKLIEYFDLMARVWLVAKFSKAGLYVYRRCKAKVDSHIERLRAQSLARELFGADHGLDTNDFGGMRSDVAEPAVDPEDDEGVSALIAALYVGRAQEVALHYRDETPSPDADVVFRSVGGSSSNLAASQVTYVPGRSPRYNPALSFYDEVDPARFGDQWCWRRFPGNPEPYFRPKRNIVRPDGSVVFQAEANADGSLKTDWLLVSKLPNFCASSPEQFPSYLFCGLYGPASIAVSDLVCNQAALRSIVAQTRGARWWQAVIPIRNIRHPAGGVSSGTIDVQSIVAESVDIPATLRKQASYAIRFGPEVPRILGKPGW